MMRMSRRRGIARVMAFVAIVGMTGSSVQAAEVTLKMKGGDFSVSGDLQSFDNSKYVIQSKSFGTMSLDATRFDCEGAGCPRAGTPFVPAVARPAAIGGGTVQITGSNTVGQQLMPALIQSYAQSAGLKVTKIVGENPLDLTFKLTDAKNKDFGTVELHRYGSTTAFTGFKKKNVDIGMSSRQIKTEEVTKLAALGLGDMRSTQNEHIISLDGLQVLVAQGNPAVSLSIDNIAKIFSEQIKNWSEVGLPAAQINVYAPGPDSGTFESFDSLVLKPRNIKIVATAKRF